MADGLRVSNKGLDRHERDKDVGIHRSLPNVQHAVVRLETKHSAVALERPVSAVEAHGERPVWFVHRRQDSTKPELLGNTNVTVPAHLRVHSSTGQ